MATPSVSATTGEATGAKLPVFQASIDIRALGDEAKALSRSEATLPAGWSDAARQSRAKLHADRDRLAGLLTTLEKEIDQGLKALTPNESTEFAKVRGGLTESKNPNVISLALASKAAMAIGPLLGVYSQPDPVASSAATDTKSPRPLVPHESNGRRLGHAIREAYEYLKK